MTEFTIGVGDFDASLLPELARTPGTEAFRQAVVEWFAKRIAQIGGHAAVVVDAHNIAVRWEPLAGTSDPVEFGIDLLKRGRMAEGAEVLEALAVVMPDDINIRFNLGMALSDLNRLGEASKHLEKAVALAPSFSNALVALGVAQERMGDAWSAKRSFESALTVDPRDGYAHRNLGAVLMKLGDSTSAGQHLEKAYDFLPDDPQAQYGYASWLLAEDSDESVRKADGILTRLVEQIPASHPIGERARDARSKLAMRNLRSVGGDVRMDAVMYLLGALERFASMPKHKVQEVGFEVAMLGQRGLDVNDSAQKYKLRTLPGNFSGLHLMSYMYAAFQLIDPALDIGFDLSKEYAVAKSMFRDPQKQG